MKSICSYYHSRGIIFFKDLVQLHGWDEQLSDIKKIESTFQQSISEYTNQQKLGSFEDIKDNIQELPSQHRDLQQEEKNGNCMKGSLLTHPNHDMERIEGMKGQSLHESSVWILLHPYFTDWRRNKTTQFLWVRGDPSKGKTMLLISIIKSLLKSPPESTGLSIFFCQETDANPKNVIEVLRGLMYRLIGQRPSLIKQLRE